MTKESQRAIAALMALIQTTKNADIILPHHRVSPPRVGTKKPKKGVPKP